MSFSVKELKEQIISTNFTLWNITQSKEGSSLFLSSLACEECLCNKCVQKIHSHVLPLKKQKEIKKSSKNQHYLIKISSLTSPKEEKADERAFNT